MKSLIIAEGDSSPKMFKLNTQSRQHKRKATIQDQVENAYVRLAYLTTLF